MNPSMIGDRTMKQHLKIIESDDQRGALRFAIKEHAAADAKALSRSRVLLVNPGAVPKDRYHRGLQCRPADEVSCRLSKARRAQFYTNQFLSQMIATRLLMATDWNW